jgi:hypothetical protein
MLWNISMILVAGAGYLLDLLISVRGVTHQAKSFGAPFGLTPASINPASSTGPAGSAGSATRLSEVDV